MAPAAGVFGTWIPSAELKGVPVTGVKTALRKGKGIRVIFGERTRVRESSIQEGDGDLRATQEAVGLGSALGERARAGG